MSRFRGADMAAIRDSHCPVPSPLHGIGRANVEECGLGPTHFQIGLPPIRNPVICRNRSFAVRNWRSPARASSFQISLPRWDSSGVETTLGPALSAFSTPARGAESRAVCSFVNTRTLDGSEIGSAGKIYMNVAARDHGIYVVT